MYFPTPPDQVGPAPDLIDPGLPPGDASLKDTLEWRDLNVQHRGFPLVQRFEAAIDRCDEVIGLRHMLAMGAEGTADIRKPTLLALAARCEPRLKRIGLCGHPLRIDPLHRRLDRDRKSTRLNSSHYGLSRMPSSA